MTITDHDLWGRLRTGDWLDAQSFPPLSYAVPGVIPEDLGILAGPPKAGKSWLALSVLLDVARGERALGAVEVGPPRPVLYFALEDGDRRMQSRARVLLGDGEPIPPRFAYLTKVQSFEVPLLMREWLEVHGSARPLVVLDTLGKVLRSTRPGEGAYERDYAVVGALKAVADDYPGTAVLLVHHTRKLGADDFMDSVNGTNGVNGAADFTLVLSRKRHDDTGMLQVTGRDVSEAEYALRLDGNRWVLDGGSAAAAAQAASDRRDRDGLGDRSAEILKLVGEHPDGITPVEVGTRLGMSNDDAGRYLRRLADADRIAKAGRGLYAAVRSVRTSEVDGLHSPGLGHSDASDTGSDGDRGPSS
ncbi:AAA domain-containing protein [Brachybacterium sp. AG952]|uniref:AAA family ATPase n=1 Tax=Brachybacterium sp. AG952 TaxID=2183989 RepID=UPI0010D5968A|nr:AAA family ATPase [Brachybacterium sp. AG952]TDP78439.1 AAA domain-containing protein [Brachybacterium sp. AG952]